MARLHLAVRSCAPLRSARWFPSDWPRCTRARRVGRGRRAARDCATRDAASRTTSRLGAPARRPLRRGMRCHAHCSTPEGALPLPEHRNASAQLLRRIPDPGSRIPSSSTVCRSASGRGCGGARGSVEWAVPSPHRNFKIRPARQPEQAAQPLPAAQTFAGPDLARRPSPAREGGGTLQPPRRLVNAQRQPRPLFSEPKNLAPSPGLLPTSVAVAALARAKPKISLKTAPGWPGTGSPSRATAWRAPLPWRKYSTNPVSVAASNRLHGPDRCAGLTVSRVRPSGAGSPVSTSRSSANGSAAHPMLVERAMASRTGLRTITAERHQGCTCTGQIAGQSGPHW